MKRTRGRMDLGTSLRNWRLKPNVGSNPTECTNFQWPRNLIGKMLD